MTDPRLFSTGAQPGLVSTHAGHVAGQQRRGRRAERDQEPAGEAGVHHEAGVQPVGPADRAQGAGWCDEAPSVTRRLMLRRFGKCDERQAFV